MEAGVSKYRENTGTAIGKLRELPLGEQFAIDVDLVDAASARTLITIIHGEEGPEGKRLKTKKTLTGIKVWRDK